MEDEDLAEVDSEITSIICKSIPRSYSSEWILEEIENGSSLCIRLSDDWKDGQTAQGRVQLGLEGN